MVSLGLEPRTSRVWSERVNHYNFCPTVRKIIHSLKLVDYLHVQADNPWLNYYLCFTYRSTPFQPWIDVFLLSSWIKPVLSRGYRVLLQGHRKVPPVSLKLIRRRFKRRLIWVCTVCLCPTKMTLVYGLIRTECGKPVRKELAAEAWPLCD